MKRNKLLQMYPQQSTRNYREINFECTEKNEEWENLR